MKFLSFLFLIFCSLFSYSQNVGIGTTTPNSSAALEIKSSSQGFLPPRMTTAQKKSISNPTQGLMVYCTDCGIKGEPQYFDGTEWQNLNNHPIVAVTDSTTTIGSMVWGRKNLNVTHYRNGDSIPQVTDPSQWASLTTGAWCWYNNDSALYDEVYGKLYNWYAVNDPRGLAPNGWHIPTNLDYKELVNLTNCPDVVAGGFLKATGTTYWEYPNSGANNITGFNAVAGGFRDESGFFSNLKRTACFWSNYGSPVYTYGLVLSYDNWYAWYYYHNSRFGYSVRCIQD